MKLTKPSFNIVIPKDIGQIFKKDRKKFSGRLSELLRTNKIASLRLTASNLNENEIIEIIDHTKKISRNNIPILLENRIKLAVQLKVDGVHLTDGQKRVKTAKSLLSRDQVIGSFCGSSKHSGLVASEQGANYIAFRTDFNTKQADKEITDLFKWWADFIEIPIMGEWADNCLISKNIWKYCDFVSLKNEIWCPEVSIESIFSPLTFTTN